MLPFQSLTSRELKVIGLVSDYRKDGEFAPPVNFMFFARIPVGADGADRRAIWC